MVRVKVDDGSIYDSTARWDGEGPTEPPTDSLDIEIRKKNCRKDPTELATTNAS